MGFFATSGILNQTGFFGEGFDPDALDYINRVETADGERLEPRVRTNRKCLELLTISF